MGLFGWSLPAGCGRLPGEEDYDLGQPRCRKCGAWLSPNRTRTESWEVRDKDTGELIDCGNAAIHTCRKCGNDNRFD